MAEKPRTYITSPVRVIENRGYRNGARDESGYSIIERRSNSVFSVYTSVVPPSFRVRADLPKTAAEMGRYLGPRDESFAAASPNNRETGPLLPVERKVSSVLPNSRAHSRTRFPIRIVGNVVSDTGERNVIK